MGRKASSSKKAVMALSAVVSAGLVGIVVVGLSTAAPAAGVLRDPTTISYASTTVTPPVQIANAGPEEYHFAELGNEVNLANAGALSSVIVTMSILSCERGDWDHGDCSTTPGATFPVPITLKIYNPPTLGNPSTPGALIATDTQNLRCTLSALGQPQVRL